MPPSGCGATDTGIVVASMAGHRESPHERDIEHALATTPTPELLALPFLQALGRTNDVPVTSGNHRQPAGPHRGNGLGPTACAAGADERLSALLGIVANSFWQKPGTHA
jgi:hypothetical protein